MIERTVVVLPMPLRPSSVTTSPGADLEVDAEQHLARAVAGCEAAHLEQHAVVIATAPCLVAEVGLRHFRVARGSLPARRWR